ncbi:hypothetical protein L1987_60039 [Smallanthus sonchifolius]|uniref:Uncharacterized protein n=1 Tax=Smallanthus sonchifolius TaxID=185202 RepID=A0ACB9D6X9_9ASTR|nr:hypothetical protein L1987_60039 [Smallanthus sonchifolius]
MPLADRNLKVLTSKSNSLCTGYHLDKITISYLLKRYPIKHLIQMIMKKTEKNKQNQNKKKTNMKKHKRIIKQLRSFTARSNLILCCASRFYIFFSEVSLLFVFILWFSFTILRWLLHPLHMNRYVFIHGLPDLRSQPMLLLMSTHNHAYFDMKFVLIHGSDEDLSLYVVLDVLALQRVCCFLFMRIEDKEASGLVVCPSHAHLRCVGSSQRFFIPRPPSFGTQRLKELAVKQLITMTPSMPKALIVFFIQRPHICMSHMLFQK